MRLLLIGYAVMAPLLVLAKASPWTLVVFVWVLCFALWQSYRCIVHARRKR